MFCTADPEPERCGGVARVIRVVEGATTLPIPKPNTNGMRISNHTGVVRSRRVNMNIAVEARTRPNGMTRRAPNRATILPLRGADSSCPIANGTVSAPDCSGDHPRTTW